MWSFRCKKKKKKNLMKKGKNKMLNAKLEHHMA